MKLLIILFSDYLAKITFMHDVSVVFLAHHGKFNSIIYCISCAKC